ncbi:MAG: hypothetical protein GX488_11690 [Clostridiales bacterium]|nr:hypothetical protein [Clostridiales bacterium]
MNIHNHVTAIKELEKQNCQACLSRNCEKCAVDFALKCIRRDKSLWGDRK